MPGNLMAAGLMGRSGHALDRALQLAETLGDELEILHLVDDSLSSRVAEETARSAHEILSPDAAGAAQVNVRFGHRWRLIFDLVVVGAHCDRGPIDLFRGSVLHRCGQMSPAPVLVGSDRPLSLYRRVMTATNFATRDAEAVRLAAMAD